MYAIKVPLHIERSELAPVISDLSKGGIHAIKVPPHFERSKIVPKLFQISQKEVFTQ
jgi:hypothetical protein